MNVWLLVRRDDLARELTRMARLARAMHKRAEAVLAFGDGRLTIALPGMRTAIPADGKWVPSVRVPARILLDFGRRLPKEDPFLLKVEEDHLVLGGHAIPCQRDHPELRLVRLPLNASPADILRVASTYTPEEIERSGLSPLVRQAQARHKRGRPEPRVIWLPLYPSLADILRVAAMCTPEEIEQSGLAHRVRRAQARRRRLVAQAGVLLAPLGISTDDLNQLVDKRLRELPVVMREGL